MEKSRFLYEGAEVTFDEKSVSKSLAKTALAPFLKRAHAALLPVSNGLQQTLTRHLRSSPNNSTSKNVVFQAVRVAECGNMVSRRHGESMALLGKDIALHDLKEPLK